MPVPLTPGNTPVFQVTPTFSGEEFALVAANAFVGSSNPTLFPAELVPSDATGTSFTGTIGPVTVPTAVSVSWGYHNPDGTLATVNTTFTVEPAAVDDVTGGTVTQTT